MLWHFAPSWLAHKNVSSAAVKREWWDPLWPQEGHPRQRDLFLFSKVCRNNNKKLFFLWRQFGFASCHLALFTEQSSGIFSSELLLPERLSWYSRSLNLSATHCAVSRASGSWSQHSTSVSHTFWRPWKRQKKQISPSKSSKSRHLAGKGILNLPWWVMLLLWYWKKAKEERSCCICSKQIQQPTFTALPVGSGH